MNPGLAVAFALIDTLPRGEYPVDALYDEGGARRLVAGLGVTLPAPYDRLPTFSDRLMGREQAPPGDDDDQFPAVHELRAGLEPALFGDQGEALESLNALSRRFALIPRWAAGEGPTYRSQVCGWGPALAAFVVPEVAALHATGRIADVRRCVARWCERPFLDATGSGRRRFCSPRCAARVRQARRRWGSDEHLLAPSASGIWDDAPGRYASETQGG